MEGGGCAKLIGLLILCTNWSGFMPKELGHWFEEDFATRMWISPGLPGFIPYSSTIGGLFVRETQWAGEWSIARIGIA